MTINAFCPHCRWTGPPDARFCGRCGSATRVSCPSCDSYTDRELPFCTQCGERLADSATPLPPVERRRVSVLFVDLTGFTALSETLDPEDVRALQSAYFAKVRQVAERYGGVVEKYIGDAVMVVFGAPVAHDDDPTRAVRTGLDVLRELDQQEVGGQQVRIRVGVATGEAVVDRAAARPGGQGMLSGDVVNLSSRLQTATEPGTVLVDAATRRATVEQVRYLEMPPVELRGKQNPVPVWLAVGALTPPDSPAHRAIPLIGRDPEIEGLWSATRMAFETGTSRLVTVLGDPGVGKSRLVKELRRRLRGTLDLDARWRMGRCLPYGQGIAYWALGEIVKIEAGILDSDDADAAGRRLEVMLDELLPEAADAELRGVRDALAPLVGLEASQATAEDVASAWRRVLRAMAAQRPTVLVFEDLHWADDGLVDFVESLLAYAVDVPLVVVAVARPELLDRRPGFGKDLPHVVMLPLGPLDETAVSQLFSALLGTALLPADTQQRLIELAGGNPLYAEEYVRMLADSGVLERAGRSWRLAGAAEIPMPDTVEGVIASRLDLLDPADLGVLQAAAVVGYTFWPGAVAATAGLPRELVSERLDALRGRGLVREQAASTVDGEDEMSFHHILVRDAAYSRLPRGHRAGQHRRVADWLDALGGDRAEDLAELLAHHRLAAYELTRGESGADAAWLALARAAERAYRLHAFPAALDYLRRAPEAAAAQVGVGVLLRTRRLACELEFLVEPEEFFDKDGRATLEAVIADLVDAGEVREAARGHIIASQMARAQARSDATMAHLTQALELLADQPDSEDEAIAYAELARLHMARRDLEAVTAAASQAEAIATRLDLPEVVGNAKVTGAAAQYQSGTVDGLAVQEAVVAYCRDRKLRAFRRAAHNLAVSLAEEGDMRRSFALDDEAFRFEASAGVGHLLITRGPDKPERAFCAGDWESLLGEIENAVTANPDNPWDAHLRGFRSWIRLLRGEDPGDDIERCLELSRGRGFPSLEWVALAHTALARMLQGNVDETAVLMEDLAAQWRAGTVIPERMWLPPAVLVVAALGPPLLDELDAWLTAQPLQTRWVRAARAVTAGGLAACNGDQAAAGAKYAEAAHCYDDIGSATDAALCHAEAARAFQTAGDPAADDHLTVAAEFARRNQAYRLLEGLDLPGAIAG
jgi:class 3 adenylate cyclase/tetratricopeptide (TPR) repeat protein